MRFNLRFTDVRGKCKTCDNLMAVVTDRETQAYCRASFAYDNPVPIRGVIHECTEYDERGRMSLREMKQVAHVLDMRGDKVGFKGPKRLNERLREELEELHDPDYV